MDQQALAKAAQRLKDGRILVLTGAGISVDSGIPDFRSAGGLWERYPVEEYATIDAFRADPRKVWRLFAELARDFSAVRPNAGHAALARLEAAGLVSGVITQNIDGLHQRAGSRNVIEYHGSSARLACLACGARYPAGAPPRTADGVPVCTCGAVLKPDVILFGEMIPYDALRESKRLAADARTCLVCGTSALVHPASAIPDLAAEAGATVIEVNLERTPLTDRITRIFLQGGTSAVLPALADAVLGTSS